MRSKVCPVTAACAAAAMRSVATNTVPTCLNVYTQVIVEPRTSLQGMKHNLAGAELGLLAGNIQPQPDRGVYCFGLQRRKTWQDRRP